MWNNYFFEIQKKYNMRISKSNPFVVRFDGKDVTKDSDINLLYTYKGSMLEALDVTSWYFSKKYHCYVIYGSDEISFIVPDPQIIIDDCSSDNSDYSNEIIALISQYFFDYFNSMYNGKKLFWHGKCFSIPKGKLISYIKYRSGVIKNVMTTYFLKRKNIHMGNEKINVKMDKCLEYDEFKNLGDAVYGTLYYDGEKLDLFEFLNGNVVKINDKKDNILDSIENNDDEFSIEFVDF